MNLFHIGSEFRRFGHGKLPPLALLVIILLPLLFGGLFVWSYWDPIGRLDKLPVAIVNSDEGADSNGQHINAGDQVIDGLLQNKSVKFVAVSADEAKTGIEDGTYYFGIELPTDFSQAAVSANTDTPHQATLNAVYNNNNGFLATMLGNQVVSKVLATVNQEVGSQVANKLLVGFNTIGSGLHTAGDGANQLAEGATKAKDGSTTLADGAQELSDNMKTADDGAQQLATGAEKLDSGISTASQGADTLASGLSQLDAATDTLGNGAGQVSQGVDQVVGMADQASNAQSQLVAPLVNLSAQLRSTGLPQASQMADQADAIITQLNSTGIGQDSQMITQLHSLRDGAAEVQRQLVDPTAEYRAGVDKAAAGSQELATGLHTLSDGSQQLVVGAKKLADGTSKLAAGSEQLTVGAQQLSSGLVTLDSGSGELALKLNDSAGQVPSFSDDTIDGASTNVSTPVALGVPKDQLSKFGVGLAPMFISLGLFMGGTVCFMVMRPLQRRAIESRMNPARAVLATYTPAAIVGVCQATVMFFVQKLFIGLHASTELGLWAAMAATSLLFICITQGLNSVFGATVGRVLCIALMSLQIVSSGGLYPPETQPAPLRWFNTYDPMTYTVNLIRHMINGPSTSGDPRVWQAMWVMALIFVIFFVASSLSARRERQMQMKDLHPEVAV